MHRLKLSLIPFIVFLFSFMVRLALISKGPYHVDCLHLAINAEKTLSTGELHYQFGPGYLLTVYLGSVFVLLAKLFSITDPVVAVNFMSVLFSSLTVVVSYFLTRVLLDPITALFSSLLLSLSPIFLGISVYGNSHTVSLFFLLSSILCLWSYLKTQNRKYFLASAILFGGMGAARLQDMLLMIIPLSYLIFSSFKKSPSIKSLSSYLALAFFVTALLYLPLILQKDHSDFISQFSRFWQIGVTGNFLGILSEALKWTMLYLAMTLFPIGFLLVFLGSYFLYKDQRKIFSFLFFWFLIPFLFYGNLFSTAPRFLVIILPSLMITQGYLLARLSQGANLLNKIVVLVIFLIAVAVTFSDIYPKLKLRHQYALLPDFAKWASQKTEPHAQIICADEGPFLIHYGQRTPLERPLNEFHLRESELAEFKSQLDGILKENIPVYILSTGLYAYDPKHQFSNFMKKNYRLQDLGRHLSEDWHRGEIFLRTQQQHLYRIYKK